MFVKIEVNELHQVFTFILKKPLICLYQTCFLQFLLLWRKMFLIFCKCVLGHVRRSQTIYINGMNPSILDLVTIFVCKFDDFESTPFYTNIFLYDLDL
jgi:hypothetical protein